LGEVIEFVPPDNPVNVAALVAMGEAVDLAMMIGFDRETFLSAAANVWDYIDSMEAAEEQ
jgi:hypothetical protein